MSNAWTNEEREWPTPLWNAYWQGAKNASIRDQLVTHFYSLVAPWVARLRRGLPRHVDPDLLESAAAQGLVEAVEQFDPKKSDNFRIYAEMVMRRRVTDALRRYGPSPGHLEARDNTLREKNEMALSQQMGRRPSEEELDQFLRQHMQNADAETAPKRQTQRLRNRGRGKPASLSDGTDGACRSLDVRNTAILRLYLDGDFSQQRIAEFFGITQARVSQILHQARTAYIPHESISGGQCKCRSTR
jgi:RNA polymerase sigma factor (sigma-70 family)